MVQLQASWDVEGAAGIMQHVHDAAPAATFSPVVPVPISCVEALPTMTAPAANM